MTQSVATYFVNNYNIMETISKKLLKSRFREGLSLYYIHLHKKKETPVYLEGSITQFIKNINKPNGDLHRSPVNLSYIDYDLGQSEDPTEKMDMMLDIKDEMIIDFLLNGKNNDKWIKIYDVIYNKKLELNMFESIVYDYVFIKHMSISQISAITGNSRTWVQTYRKQVIQKIKDKL